MTFWITSILDGFSRKLLALKISATTPTTDSVLEVFRSAMALFGVPRFAITDKGAQFRETFAELIRPMGIDVIRGPAQHPQFNGKIERFFRTLKIWQRPASSAWFPDVTFIQRCLESFRGWYNEHRVHQGVHGLTPDEAWSGIQYPAPVRYFARDNLNPVTTVQRLNHNSDPHLHVFVIRVVSPKSA